MALTRWIYRATCECGHYLGVVQGDTPFLAAVYLDYPLCQECGADHGSFNPKFTVAKVQQIRNPKKKWWNSHPTWIDVAIPDGV